MCRRTDRKAIEILGLGDQLEAYSRTVDFEAFRADIGFVTQNGEDSRSKRVRVTGRHEQTASHSPPERRTGIPITRR